jgi:acyl-lipid omega-6 desaturase (Delta-12 desaturase)
VVLWALLIFLQQHGVNFVLLLPLILLASGLLMRIFIIFHDCVHNAFFPSKQANRIVGHIAGILTFTPYDTWQHSHSLHHATSSDLDRRGHGDIWTLTSEEYTASPWYTKALYQLFRNPLFLILVAGPFKFIVIYRFARPSASKRGHQSVLITNLALLSLLALSYFTIGIKAYLVLQLPIIALAAMGGVWLFYLQHQFEDAYWARHQEWDPMRAALEGSSYYKLPVVLQWFTGNIGMHHIHHLRPGIPNYNLQWCYREIPALQQARPISIARSFKCFNLNLWDETKQKMVSFRDQKHRDPS